MSLFYKACKWLYGNLWSSNISVNVVIYVLLDIFLRCVSVEFTRHTSDKMLHTTWRRGIIKLFNLPVCTHCITMAHVSRLFVDLNADYESNGTIHAELREIQ